MTSDVSKIGAPANVVFDDDFLKENMPNEAYSDLLKRQVKEEGNAIIDDTMSALANAAKKGVNILLRPETTNLAAKGAKFGCATASPSLLVFGGESVIGHSERSLNARSETSKEKANQLIDQSTNKTGQCAKDKFGKSTDSTIDTFSKYFTKC